MFCVFFSYNENRKVMDFGYPRSVIEDFPGVNSTINAAFYKGGEYKSPNSLGNIPYTVCTGTEESFALGAFTFFVIIIINKHRNVDFHLGFAIWSLIFIACAVCDFHSIISHSNSFM